MEPPVDMPDLPLSGGCQCGAVRYRLTAAPTMFYWCHCTECQGQSASAFGESLRMRPADVEVEGTVRTYVRAASGGGSIACRFCPQCGVRLFHQSVGDENELSVKAGTLDDTSWLVPAAHIWTRSKQAWTNGDDGTLVFETEPDDFTAIAVRWQSMLSRGRT